MARFTFDEQPLVQDVLTDVVALYEAWDRPDDSDDYRARLLGE